MTAVITATLLLPALGGLTCAPATIVPATIILASALARDAGSALTLPQSVPGHLLLTSMPQACLGQGDNLLHLQEI